MRFLVKEIPSGAVRRALSHVNYNKRDIEVTAATSYTMSAGGGGAGQRDFVAVVNLDSGEFDLKYGSWGGQNMFVKSIDDDDERRALDDHTAVIKGSASHTAGYATIKVSQSTLSHWESARAAPAVSALHARAAAGDAAAKEQLVRMDAALERGESVARALLPEISKIESAVLEAFGGLTSAGRKKEFDNWIYSARSGVGGRIYRSPFEEGQFAGSATPGRDAQKAIDAATESLVARGYLKRNKAGAVQITPEGRNARRK